MNRSYLVASTVAHAAAIWALFLFVPATQARLPVAIQVALVNLPAGAMTPPRGEPTAAPNPEPRKDKEPDVRPEEPTAERNAIRPERPNQPTPRRPQPGLPGATRTDTAPLGSPGLSGDVAVDVANFEFTYYLVLIRNRISENWGAPAGLITDGNRIRATVYFKIDRLGRVSGVRLEDASGVVFFDQSALRAVNVSNPLPPLPAGYGESSLGVHFGFEYLDR